MRTIKEDALLKQPALVVVAHPDDECIGLGVYLQRCLDAQLLFMTSGGGHNTHPSHRSIMAKRESEARSVVNTLPTVNILGFERFPDMSLWRHLSDAARRIERALVMSSATIMITHAFEGGHPDHDCCSFLANRVGKRLNNLDVIEFPLYSNRSLGLVQEFVNPGETISLTPSEEEQLRKASLFELHVSQQRVLRRFGVDIPERFRRQPHYDFDVPTWSDYYVDVRVQDVTAAFRQFDQLNLGSHQP